MLSMVHVVILWICHKADLKYLVLPKTQSKAAKIESLLIYALNVASIGISEVAQMVSSSKSCSKDHVAVPEVYEAVPKLEPRPTVDLTESCSTDSPPVKKQKTFDIEKIIMGDELSDGEIYYAQWLL